MSLIESGILRQMFGSLLRKAQYSSLDLSESQQENAEDSDVRDERAFPDVGITSPVNILNVVVFPAPF
jgi:hypothetical protein